ncbi:hypothetical protein DEU56DRAFT_756368 [Suillus clintonianus]|uniref:uncharacterized protein n=1 Tax=Suillus clintonianus TaxID=1904413 RepID=UPI001B861C11|nr:uncharacterized protein DEU56DRAFT_756368 [Suillus clintonianus]KAG2136469.1 hypothetical protein DEU56DRAFT_756368 [Suillus clintonianus]
MFPDDADIDIFAPLPAVPDDEQTSALKDKIQELCGGMQGLIDSAPAENEGTLCVEKEEWCRRWIQILSTLNACLTVARKNRPPLDLTVAQRQLGGKVQLKHQAFQREISKMKDAVAMQASAAAQAKAPAGPDEQQHSQTTTDPMETCPQEQEQPQEEQEEHEQEQDHESDADEEEREAVEMLATKSIVVQRMKQSPIPVESDTEGSITFMSKKAKKFTSPMSAATPKVNPVSCARCIEGDRKCYSNPAGMVCLECKRLKAGCSLVAEKGKTTATATPAPAAPQPAAAPTVPKTTATPKPPMAPTAPTITAAPRPRPAPKSAPAPEAKDKGHGKANAKCTASPTPQPVAGISHTTPEAKDKGKAKAKSTASPTPRLIAGPSNAIGPCVHLNSSHKRKQADNEGEEHSESAKEDAYLAGRIQALPGLISMVETALASPSLDGFEERPSSSITIGTGTGSWPMGKIR